MFLSLHFDIFDFLVKFIIFCYNLKKLLTFK